MGIEVFVDPSLTIFQMPLTGRHREDLNALKPREQDDHEFFVKSERGQLTTLCDLMKLGFQIDTDLNVEAAIRALQESDAHSAFVQSPQFLINKHGRGSPLDMCVALSALAQ
eukprot:Gregarina_sp_Poly_1__301@NODE_1075_length_5172_cov_40_719491_g538_i1_p7_GENE_NODE_1075_length_5172_cov_40_719491_g538_i1NODE_1075_length_5172_cov_40_719491_g538_i1_p7_ORF_typecomplete_len112_score13_11_NODE_1075_length_5172_cov_40_719491_g538_i126612996